MKSAPTYRDIQSSLDLLVAMNCSFIITVSGSINFICDFDKVQLYHRYNRGRKERQ